MGQRFIELAKRVLTNPHCRALTLSRLAIVAVLVNLGWQAAHPAKAQAVVPSPVSAQVHTATERPLLVP